MDGTREEFRSGIECLEAVTELLHRIRCADPTAGLYDAAELQWWWGQRRRPTDEFAQLFWFDEQGPMAAAIATAFGDETRFDLITAPTAKPAWRRSAVERAFAHLHAAGIESVTFELDPSDDLLREVMSERGFAVEKDGGLVESWLAADDRPPISPLAEGYRLSSRAESVDRPHHMSVAGRSAADVEARLQQCSLYRSDLDLVVYDQQDRIAAYGLFWHDPVTRVGVVEPMRTEDEHQRRGLARHVLTTGIERLAALGVGRIKICFEPDNAASSHLYLDAGFVPHRSNDMVSGPTGS